MTVLLMQERVLLRDCRPSFQEIFSYLENAQYAPGQVQTPSAVPCTAGTLQQFQPSQGQKLQMQPGVLPGHQMNVQQQPHQPVGQMINRPPHCTPGNMSWSEVTAHAPVLHPNAH